jgi:2-polyprenyl-6-hydroxyphenyl methylase/3-demethylubiquinone-9 3-methyltransferase
MHRAEDQRFEFGRNWHDFIQKNYDNERVEISRRHILAFMDRANLEGLSVLDIGCGSGLHSLAMIEAGADSVHGFDYDYNAVKASEFVQQQVGWPANWTVELGSVLDDAYVAQLPMVNFVYSWGVLHHTGDVWHATRNAASRVKPGGLLYIALYSADVQIDPPPEFWLDVKRKYVASGTITRRMVDWWYVWRFELNRDIRNIPDFLAKTRDYKKKRGMSKFTDIRDWLGGWPMEFVYDKEAVDFVEKLGFKFEKIATGEANTEFLFLREPGLRE